MGNQMSVPQRVEDQENESETDANKVIECGQNGTPVIISTHDIPFYDEVDLGISVKEDNVATSSPKTMEISAVADANGKNLGKEAKPEAPAAKSRFFLTLSRPVPGRTGDRATDSSTGSVKLDVSSSDTLGNKEPSESVALPVAAALGHNPHKTPGQSPAGDGGFSAPWGPAPVSPESGGVTPSKPEDSSFLDKLFKLDKGREKAPVKSHREAKGAERQDQAREVSGLSRPSDDVPAERNIVDSKGREGHKIPTVRCSVPEDPEELETAKEDPQTTNTTENNNSIMSFFKTLVSPSKAETKKDLEDTGAEKSPATSSDVKSDKANFISQESRGEAKNPTSTNTTKEAAKEKGGPTSLPLGKLFWKKSVKEDSVPAEENVVCESPVEVVKSEEVESTLQTVDLNEEGDATPEPTEVRFKREERKPPRTSLMAFLRQMRPDSPEKAITSPEPEPAGADQKGKESSSKDKKVVAEGNKQKSNKQEAKELVQCVEPAAGEANSVQNGDKAQKRQEKRRQSLGGFFKGLGPKRMLDAQVQTDPVSIGPVGKSK
ncbi:breast carcinoma-amplified sequence 1 isoform X4 [Eumetopias jubatus]|uniref:breast carcinoma-amplified sequence 1 isoform X4 n=1 Tax=Eumetopias jubatus TaxID=34886 RepID=UPI0010169EF1|nr:breast carcinoma-amplified sequence 1 isoform X4 [Eumetopias jubatus]